MSEPDQMGVEHNLFDKDNPFRILEDSLTSLPSDHSLTSSAEFRSTSAVPGSSPSRSSFSSRSTAVSSDRVTWGNICPHGVITSGFKSPPKTRVLRPGHSDYGYGSIINPRKIIQDELQSGEDAFKKGQYIEALEGYDRVLRMKPKSATCRISRADTLVQLGRFEEALREYHVAYKLEQGNVTVHHRLSLFYLRLGVVDIAEMHMSLTSPEYKGDLSVKIEKVKGHLINSGNARRCDSWKAALREVDAIIATGADTSRSILAFRAEMLLQLNRLEQAEETFSKAIELDSKLPSLAKFLGMEPEAYVCAVHAQIEMAMGRFENAVAAADRAHRVDRFNDEISAIQTNVRLTSMARLNGNVHYRERQYLEACDQYNIGLKYARSNACLLSNLAACHWQLGNWEKCIEICDQVLQIRPGYIKALLRRAESFAKLEKWAESVRDYEAAMKIFPENAKIVEALSHAQIALRKSQGEDVSRMISGTEVKDITSAEHFQESISESGASVVYFMEPSNAECNQISPFVNSLCTSFPLVIFIKVDISQHPLIAKTENVHVLPSFIIYKNGNKVKEMICPLKHVLQSWVEYYSFSD
ncbi:hypothetical protein LUZ63_014133 [Rhynchospora breviuscula]|uniref:Thioredoxin domain-containing protein n=1 Tax=Rhynchospora breviuscula TaxID=2022672 RepID=A0A9Q0C9X7_9POAL|nr:hypothetical protein LUZ63_014133 [Rhynchospora breviuscula]